MIRVSFSPSDLTDEEGEWWSDWEARAERATRAAWKAVEDEKPPSFDQSVWADLKKWLFKKVFFGKCAYCEGKVTAQSYGDAEHWRPKGAVEERREGKLMPVEQEGVPHPGYWWLAYEWTNLLPACQRCNSAPGKGTQFPVHRTHAFKPSDAPTVEELDDLETPLLLHPFRGEDPEDHIGFNELGQVFAIEESVRGDVSIAVFDLTREDLAEERRTFIRNGESKFAQALWISAHEERPFKDVIRSYFDASQEYSAAVRANAGQWLANFIRTNA